MTATDDPGPQRFYHGTKAGRRPGDLIEPGDTSYVYLTGTFDAAAWVAELTPGEGPGRIYEVEPTGATEDDPAATEKEYPGATDSYRSREALRVTDECADVHGHPRRLYHGTKADLKPGDLIGAGWSSNFGTRKQAAWVYVTGTLDAATWGAELALGEGPGRIYVVEPTGPIEDDPNLTDKRFPGNPTKSYRSREPLRVAGEVTDWQGHAPEALKAMQDALEEAKRLGIEAIEE
jgi:hypothetical protein